MATINYKTDYIETTSEIFSSGKIILEHKGASIAKFNVEWEELSYDDKGNPVLTPQSWNKNNKNLTTSFREVIHLKANARNICVKAQGKTGLVWDQWRTSIDKKIFH